MEEVLHWYAIKVFWNRTQAVKEMLDERGIEYYAQSIMPSFLFLHTTPKTIILLRQTEFNRFYVYIDLVTRIPSPIPDREIEIFKIVTSAGTSGFEFLGEAEFSPKLVYPCAVDGKGVNPDQFSSKYEDAEPISLAPSKKSRNNVDDDDEDFDDDDFDDEDEDEDDIEEEELLVDEDFGK